MRKRIPCFLITLVAMLSICVNTVYAEAQLYHVTDAAGLLTQDQLAGLEQKAEAVSTEYGVGVYIVTVEDYQAFSTEGVYTATYGIYHEYTMGEGEGRDGIMLLLSMKERDWAMFCYGDNCQYAFDAYGQEQLEEVFLDDFGNDDWYGGFEDYIEECEVYLQKAAAGDPVRESPAGYIVFAVAIALFIALLAVGGVWVVTKSSVKKQSTANAYVAGTLDLTGRYDIFTHKTQTRHKIESSSSGGSRSHSGGGGSGRSGKF